MIAREKRAIEESLRQRIEQRAYEIWENEGGPHGRDVDHWLRAEAEITGSATTPTTPSKPQRPLHSRPKVKRHSTRQTDLRRGKTSRP